MTDDDTRVLHIYLQRDPRHKRANQLRGGHAFLAVDDPDEYGVRVHWPRLGDGGGGRVGIGTGLWFTDLTTAEAAHPNLYQPERLASAKMILDVHFPLFAPTQILSLPEQPGAPRELADDLAAQLDWSDPERIDRAIRLIHLAHAVTTPHARWAQILRQGLRTRGYAGDARKVHVLPDVTSAATGGEFIARLAAIARTAHLGPVRRALVLAWLGSDLRSMRRSVTALLAAGDIDWSYAAADAGQVEDAS